MATSADSGKDPALSCADIAVLPRERNYATVTMEKSASLGGSAIKILLRLMS